MFRQHTTWHRGAPPLAAMLLMLSAWLPAHSQEEPSQDITVKQTIKRSDTEISGWSIALDNDLFGPANTDRDYSGGFGVSINGARTAKYWWSLDRLLKHIDAPLFAGNSSWRDVRPDHSLQTGLLIFTPQDLATTGVIEDDRPYASLVFLTSMRDYVADDARHSRYSGLTLGVLGLQATADVQRAVHKVMGSVEPRGFKNQISEGGELTARYLTGGSALRGQRLVGDKVFETKTTWETSVGYLTEASYAVSTRFGAINSPWWTFAPERVDYLAQPTPLPPPSADGSGELYVWAGAKLRLRAYNAFLQGQFRDSAHTMDASDLNHVIGEAWLGITNRLSNGTQLAYVMRYQTAEVRSGAGRRNPVWAEVTISHSF
jgi:hypothetical protein